MNEKSCGVLLHPTSLPGAWEHGGISSQAYEFVDRLAESGHTYWQILPLHPPDGQGSPYAARSAFALDPMLYDPEKLQEEGILNKRMPALSKSQLLEVAAEEFLASPTAEFRAWCDRQSYWLDDWALFTTLRDERSHQAWSSWAPPLVRRDAEELVRLEEAYRSQVEVAKFGQWVVDRQWAQLRSYADQKGVRIIGDIPIFVAWDSADVWAYREIFQVDADGGCEYVAGVPPDYFSERGQKWGNPLFDWDELAKSGYDWWIKRVRRGLETFDIARIDHFRGFESYWSVPEDAPDAVEGEWIEGPGDALFEALKGALGELPFIAEDLGIITPEVEALRDRHELPGMKILQFAFNGDEDHPFLPDNYPAQCVAYTGTHDNDTLRGWWESTDELTRHHARVYYDHPDEGILEVILRSLYASDAQLVMVPMQDLLGLDSAARMNTPGTSQDNWRWRMTPEMLRDGNAWALAQKLSYLR